jgi:hypothetical protein
MHDNVRCRARHQWVVKDISPKSDLRRLIMPMEFQSTAGKGRTCSFAGSPPSLFMTYLTETRQQPLARRAAGYQALGMFLVTDADADADADAIRLPLTTSLASSTGVLPLCAICRGPRTNSAGLLCITWLVTIRSNR